MITTLILAALAIGGWALSRGEPARPLRATRRNIRTLIAEAEAELARASQRDTGSSSEPPS